MHEKSAEPASDTIASEAIPDCYADYGFKTVSTNPGEILHTIAVDYLQ